MQCCYVLRAGRVADFLETIFDREIFYSIMNVHYSVPIHTSKLILVSAPMFWGQDLVLEKF